MIIWVLSMLIYDWTINHVKTSYYIIFTIDLNFVISCKSPFWTHIKLDFGLKTINFLLKHPTFVLKAELFDKKKGQTQTLSTQQSKFSQVCTFKIEKWTCSCYKEIVYISHCNWFNTGVYLQIVMLS